MCFPIDFFLLKKKAILEASLWNRNSIMGVSKVSNFVPLTEDWRAQSHRRNKSPEMTLFKSDFWIEFNCTETQYAQFQKVANDFVHIKWQQLLTLNKMKRRHFSSQNRTHRHTEALDHLESRRMHSMFVVLTFSAIFPNYAETRRYEKQGKHLSTCLYHSNTKWPLKK